MSGEPITVRSAAELPDDVRTGRRSAFKSAQIALGQSLLIAACLYLLLGGWHRDLRVPLAFSSDSLWFLMQSKSTVDNGWWWSNPRLGAPFALDELAYPSNSNVDQAIVWAVSRFVPNAAATVNLAWAIMVVLSGLSATWCMRKLGVSAINAIAGGTLFALNPYALYRNIDHFSLVIYLVPFACAAALWLASGRALQRWPWKAPAVVLAGCALLGFNYLYYAFFGVVLHRRWGALGISGSSGQAHPRIGRRLHRDHCRLHADQFNAQLLFLEPARQADGAARQSAE